MLLMDEFSAWKHYMGGLKISGRLRIKINENATLRDSVKCCNYENFLIVKNAHKPKSDQSKAPVSRIIYL